MSEKSIEIVIGTKGVSIRRMHASNLDVASLLCTGVYHVCRDLKIPVDLITDTLKEADERISKMENDSPVTEESKSEEASAAEKQSVKNKVLSDLADGDKELSELINSLKNEDVSARDLMTLAAIFSLHKAANR